MKTIRFNPIIELVFKPEAETADRWQCYWEVNLKGLLVYGVSTHALRNGALERGMKELSIRLSAHGDEEAKQAQAEKVDTKRATQ